MSFDSNLVLITGASRGLGSLVAEKFLADGYNIITVARNEEKLIKNAEELREKYGLDSQIYYYGFDLGNTNEIPFLADKIKNDAGSPGIIINNAAVQGPIGPVYTNSWNEWTNCLNTCLLAPVQICREFIPEMIKNNFGRIINISGGGATGPRPNFSSYATAKCGLVRFTETVAREVEKYDITMNCIAPGAMLSNLTKDIINAGENCAGKCEIESAKNLGVNNPETEKKAAELIHFLVKNECSGLNGKLISAVWDRWEKLPDYIEYLKNSDIYTLRRIIPEDRNLKIE
ncbi:3-oxoacyl-[acyl-carrier protein] reductase [Methanomicrobium sp. W14]|uniref:SDR family oxidoreductase n=1 Tax=Methanomicrobium sp. W14 TaxID=2817839 RepID=UPI001AE39B25|nr:SDR family oxidoreductase [Methanomicrobium sp. W14]MBP2134435.1 3-oxoacyl-[acyl-carrier protein] reductase [Methanomicrobium sp. W14]